MSPLGLLGRGEVGEVVSIRPGRHHAGNHGENGRPRHHHHTHGCNSGRRLAEMGFSQGQVIEIIENNPSMPMLVKVHDSRLAIDRSIAMHIMVRRVSK